MKSSFTSWFVSFLQRSFGFATLRQFQTVKHLKLNLIFQDHFSKLQPLRNFLKISSTRKDCCKIEKKKSIGKNQWNENLLPIHWVPSNFSSFENFCKVSRVAGNEETTYKSWIVLIASLTEEYLLGPLSSCLLKREIYKCKLHSLPS